MANYKLSIGRIERDLPIVSMGPKLSVASVNLLGDTELVDELAVLVKEKIKHLNFDYLVGPEVKVVPLLQELARLIKTPRYVVCRKRIHAYMLYPIKTGNRGLVISGSDAHLIKGKKVIIVDDVVSTGSTIYQVEKLMQLAGAQVVAKVALFVQGDLLHEKQKDLIYLAKLPIFTS